MEDLIINLERKFGPLIGNTKLVATDYCKEQNDIDSSILAAWLESGEDFSVLENIDRDRGARVESFCCRFSWSFLHVGPPDTLLVVMSRRDTAIAHTTIAFRIITTNLITLIPQSPLRDGRVSKVYYLTTTININPGRESTPIPSYSGGPPYHPTPS
jgi:hypothetical protein